MQHSPQQNYIAVGVTSVLITTACFVPFQVYACCKLNMEKPEMEKNVSESTYSLTVDSSLHMYSLDTGSPYVRVAVCHAA